MPLIPFLLVIIHIQFSTILFYHVLKIKNGKKVAIVYNVLNYFFKTVLPNKATAIDRTASSLLYLKALSL